MGQGLINSALTGFAVLWPYRGTNAEGEEIVSAPEEITARWELGGGRRSGESNSATFSGYVLVGSKVDIGSILWAGKLDELPPDPKDLYKVVGYSETSDVKGVETERSVTVSSFMSRIPMELQSGT